MVNEFLSQRLVIPVLLIIRQTNVNGLIILRPMYFNSLISDPPPFAAKSYCSN